jgi:signal transduction histidine kinase
MNPHDPAENYRDLQVYVGWTEDDAARVAALAPLLAPHFGPLVDDFYAAIRRDERTRALVGDDPERIARLKRTLVGWLTELVSGRYDAAYVERRWRVGRVHVEIGLPQVYTNVALSRLRTGLFTILHDADDLDREALHAAQVALGRLLDLDLALIEDAYQAEAAARLQRTERLAILGQVAGGIAHELRNPLNVIKTSCFYLQHARSPRPEKLDEHHARIERQVEIADGVITALSNFARMPQPSACPVAPAELVRRAFEVDPPPPGIAVSQDYPEGLPEVLADAEQIRIALGNLLRNAYDAMGASGGLAIRAAARGDAVRLDLTDTGPGVPPEQIARILEPLYSTKARGLGLGLAIARSIVERHGGRLEVASPPGAGATFTVELPAAGPATAEGSTPRTDASP